MSSDPTSRPRPFESILVGVDDERCDAAIHSALELSRRIECPLTLVHALSAPPTSKGGALAGPELAEAAFERQKARLDLAFPTAGPGAANLSDRLRIQLGEPSHVLLDRIRAAGRALLVIGPHRQRGKIDFGSSARNLLVRSQSPVWIQLGPTRPVRTILVPLELSHSTDAPLTLARDLALLHEARVVVMHSFLGPALAYGRETNLERGPAPTYVVEELARSAESQLAERVAEIDWQGVQVEIDFEENTPVEHVLSREDSTDLIVLGTRVKSVAAGLVLGSTAFRLLEKVHRPVLTVPLPS